MATRDVLLEAGQGGDTVERREWIESTLQSAVWDELRQRVDVVFHPFSAADAGEEGTDLNAALAAALSRHDNLRAAVLMSDGDWNMGDTPVVAATRLRMKEIPAFTIPLGSEIPLPDVEIVEVDPPTFSVVGKSLQIPFTVKSTLPREQRITLTLDSGDGTKLDKDIVIPAMGQTRDVIVWKPQDIGEYDLHVSVPLNSREVIADNNEKNGARSNPCRIDQGVGCRVDSPLGVSVSAQRVGQGPGSGSVLSAVSSGAWFEWRWVRLHF